MEEKKKIFVLNLNKMLCFLYIMYKIYFIFPYAHAYIYICLLITTQMQKINFWIWHTGIQQKKQKRKNKCGDKRHTHTQNPISIHIIPYQCFYSQLFCCDRKNAFHWYHLLTYSFDYLFAFWWMNKIFIRLSLTFSIFLLLVYMSSTIL